jgi:hypothetical protein
VRSTLRGLSLDYPSDASGGEGLSCSYDSYRKVTKSLSVHRESFWLSLSRCIRTHHVAQATAIEAPTPRIKWSAELFPRIRSPPVQKAFTRWGKHVASGSYTRRSKYSDLRDQTRNAACTPFCVSCTPFCVSHARCICLRVINVSVWIVDDDKGYTVFKHADPWLTAADAFAALTVAITTSNP